MGFFDGPAVSLREERADQALCVFTRMIADHVDGDILCSGAEAAATEARCRNRSGRRKDLDGHATRFALVQAAHRQIAKHQPVAGTGVLLWKGALHFEPLKSHTRHAVRLSEWVDVLLLAPVDTGPEETHSVSLDHFV